MNAGASCVHRENWQHTAQHCLLVFLLNSLSLQHGHKLLVDILVSGDPPLLLRRCNMKVHTFRRALRNHLFNIQPRGRAAGFRVY